MPAMPTEILALVDKYGWLAVMALLFVWLFLQERTRNGALQREMFDTFKANIEANLKVADALREAIKPK